VDVTRNPLLGLLLLAAMTGAGCSLVQPYDIAVPVPSMACDPVQIDPPPDLQCEAAVQAALQEIGQAGPVSAASFHYGAPCAPNMRCRFAGGNTGYVVVRLVDGRCGYVNIVVGPEAISPPRISTSVLEAWPPKEWLEMGVPLDLACQ
jgi:hypothetical protein